MYEAGEDPYCYKGSRVLRNRLGLRNQKALDAFEAEATAQRFSEPLPDGRFGVTHYRAVHRHIFGDVYAWAGRYRTTRIAKGDSLFAYPEHIPMQMRKLFGALPRMNRPARQNASTIADELAHFLAELNAIHPFRDGNGRAQLAFVTLVARNADYMFDVEKLEPRTFLAAMIASFEGREQPLARILRELLSAC